MKIINETELMNNQKATTIIVPDKQFEALQTPSGNSLVFSIGTDNILFCTCETPGDTHGWVRVDISSAISKQDFNGQPVAAKTFDLGQDPSTGNIDLVVVITAAGQDWLYASLGNATETWNNYAPAWTQFKFDDVQLNPGYSKAPINDVYVARFGSNQYIFADLLTNATTQTISRYAIDPTKSQLGQAWIPHGLAMDVQAGTASNAIGCGPCDQGVNGIYTLGSVNGDPELEYAPLFNYNNAGGPSNPTNFDMKKLADGTSYSIDSAHMAMATSMPGSDGTTDLFFASNGSLYFIAGKDQVESNNVFPAFTRIYTHSLLQNVTSLHVNTWNNNLVLWGQSISTDSIGSSQIFLMECPRGSETEGAGDAINGTAWTSPAAILYNAVNSATYINNQYGNNVIFVQQVINEVSTLTQLFEDPATSAWQQRSLLTAPDAENLQTIVYDTTTYSTHIEITDDNNTAQPNIPVSLWASSPCSVYINDFNNTDAYFTLDTVKPLLLTTDVTGNITIMQPVDTIGGISYFIAVQDTTTKKWYSEAINPLTGTVKNLQTRVPDKNDHITNATVTDEWGNTTPLVNTATYGSQTASTSTNIYDICNNASTLNQDGLAPGQSWPTPGASVSAAKRALKQPLSKGRLAKNLRFNEKTGKIWGSSFGKNAKHYEGIDDLKAMGVTLQADGTLAIRLNNGKVLNSSNSIEIAAGNFYKWMQHEAHKVETVIMTIIDGEIDCLITIADALYHFVLKCANDIVNLVHAMLNAIETAFADIVKWIGFIFEYDDILRTHAVIKNFFKLTIKYAASNVTTLQSSIQTSFTSLQNDLNGLVGLPVISDTPAGTSAQNPPPQSSKTPQANWGTHKLKSNGGNTNNTDPNFSPGSNSDPTGGKLQDLVKKIEALETTTLNQLSTNLQAIANDYQKLPVSQLVEQILVAITDFLISEAEDVILSATDVMALLLDEVYTILTGPIDIPVISWLYKKMTKGSDFDLLDLVCLVTAIPATIVYKVIEETAPFPDDATTTALANAPDFATLLSVLSQPTTGVGAHGGDDIGSSATFKTYIKVANIAALGGSVGVSVLSTLKSGIIDTLKDNKWINAVNTACYLLYVWPDLMESIPTNTTSGAWYDIMNNWCTWVAITKTLADAQCGFNEVVGTIWGVVAPWADLIINVAWQAPTCGVIADEFMHKNPNSNEKINTIINFVGGTTFDMSGWLSPVLAAVQANFTTPQGKIAIGATMAAISLLNVVWGVSCVLDSYGPFAES